MSLNDLKGEFSEEIRKSAEELSNSLPISKPQLREAFSDEEVTELHKLVTEINAATTENVKIKKLADNSKAALGLLKKLGVAI